MEAECGGQVVRGLQGLAFRGCLERAVVVFLKQRPVIRVCESNDFFYTLARCKAPQVCVAVLGDDHLDVLFGVVHVGDKRNDGGDGTALGIGRRDEGADVAVAGEVRGTADTVHHAGTDDVGGVNIAVNVGFDQAVGADQAKATYDFGVVGDLLGAQNNGLAVLGGLIVHALGVFGR